MAKGKSKGKSKTKKRRIGAMSLNPSSPLVKGATIAAGYFLAATPLNAMIDKLTKGKIDDKIVGVGQAGLGSFLLFGKKPNLIKSVVGGVVAGAGLKRVLTAFGVVTAPVAPATTAGINGYGNVPVIGRKMGGYGSVPVIGNGYTPNSGLGSYAIPSGARPGVNRVMGSRDGSTLLDN